MSVPVAVTSAVSALAQSMASASPLESASRLLLSALTSQAVAVVAVVDAGVADTGPLLDAGDPTQFVGLLPDYLSSLVQDGVDHAKIVEARGYVGRSLFYLQQAPLG